MEDVDYQYLELIEETLKHLQMIDNSLKQVADALRIQMRDDILFTEMEVEQINMLMELQERTLHAIAEIVRNGDNKRLNEVNNECSEVADSSLKFATSYESRLVEGLCTPEARSLSKKSMKRCVSFVFKNLTISPSCQYLRQLPGAPFEVFSAG